MWTPTCYGDPGKVSDAEYNCDPNLTTAAACTATPVCRTTATRCSSTAAPTTARPSPGIGLDKAANICWRAPDGLPTPTSDFTDAGRRPRASCADLSVSRSTRSPPTPNAGPMPADADHRRRLRPGRQGDRRGRAAHRPDAVRLPAAARQERPSACAVRASRRNAVWSEDFEDGLAGWTADEEIADLGGYSAASTPGSRSTTPPAATPAGVAFGPARDEGDCSGDGVDDISSRDSIISRSITLPGGGLRRGCRSTTTWPPSAAGTAATSRSASTAVPSRSIPAAAYVFNAPNARSTPCGAGNTNPIGRRARLHRHRRWRGHRVVGPVDRRPDAVGVAAGRQGPAPVRHRPRRLWRPATAGTSTTSR